MSTNPDNLEYAIFAMDSYNQGYENGMNVGIPADALFISESGDSTTGFYAVAYEYNGEIIISYRGTDDPASDASAWLTGGGAPSAQALLAIQFYQDVLTQTSADPEDLVLTGHSLGGGLAGFVASLYGVDAVVFDSMTYDLAA